MERKGQYFLGLDGLRFLAASLVIIHHVEQYRHWMGLESLWGLNYIDALGHFPVSFFFVLSGFLITYLLLSEYSRKGSIDIKFFYLKRVIRIWPLYFLIVLISLSFTAGGIGLAFGAVSDEITWSKVILPLAFILPNVLRISFPQLVGGNQLWSIGVEEQFYLIWPVLILFFIRKPKLFLVGFISVKLILHIVIWVISSSTSVIFFEHLLKLYTLFPVEQMAIGGIGALWVFDGHRSLKRLSSKWSLLIGLASIFLLVEYQFGIFKTYVEAFVFLIIILGITNNKAISSILEFRIFKYLGQISFGIYMWHTIVIAVLLFCWMEYNLSHFWMIYPLSFIGTFLVAHLSHQYFEKPFLTLRKVYSTYRDKKFVEA